jgi:hypothetical protein
MAGPKEILGFYYGRTAIRRSFHQSLIERVADEEKKKYFRIQPNHSGSSKSSAYTVDEVCKGNVLSINEETFVLMHPR